MKSRPYHLRFISESTTGWVKNCQKTERRRVIQLNLILAKFDGGILISIHSTSEKPVDRQRDNSILSMSNCFVLLTSNIAFVVVMLIYKIFK